MTKNRAVGLLRWGILVLGALNLLMTLGSLLAPLHWTLDLMTHFTLQVSGVLIILLVAGVVLRLRFLWLGLLVIGGMANAWLLYPYFLYETPPVTNDAALTVVNLNISTRDDHYSQITDYLLTTDADLVALIEVRQDMLDHLERTLSDEYPYIYAEPSRWTLGLAFLSKTPFTHTRTVPFESNGRQFLDVGIEWEDQSITFYSVHPYPPIMPQWAQSRNAEYTQFADRAANVDAPLVLVGDFNAVPWSYPVQQIQATTDLRPANLGYGVRPTWTFARFIQAPLDYLLVSDAIEVVGYEIGPAVGSDHRPVVARLRLVD
jgi:endonuclease/exonuclease/phosphatase (EEP) superfamily protein YafD